MAPSEALSVASYRSPLTPSYKLTCTERMIRHRPTVDRSYSITQESGDTTVPLVTFDVLCAYIQPSPNSFQN